MTSKLETRTAPVYFLLRKHVAYVYLIGLYGMLIIVTHVLHNLRGLIAPVQLVASASHNKVSVVSSIIDGSFVFLI